MTRSSWKQLQEELMNTLSALLTSHGFSYQKGRQSYVRSVTGGRLSFHLSFVPHRDDFDVTADFAIRNDALETLVHQNNKRISKSEKRHTYSIGAEVGNFSQGAPKRWTIRSADDLSRVVKEIYKSFESIAVPYYERYSKPDAMLEILSRNDDVGRLHCPFDHWRCMKAVALAFVLGDHDRVTKLVAQGMQFLTENDDAFGLRIFGEFVDQLLTDPSLGGGGSSSGIAGGGES